MFSRSMIVTPSNHGVEVSYSIKEDKKHDDPVTQQDFDGYSRGVSEIKDDLILKNKGHSRIRLVDSFKIGFISRLSRAGVFTRSLPPRLGSEPEWVETAGKCCVYLKLTTSAEKAVKTIASTQNMALGSACGVYANQSARENADWHRK